jgi:AraC-like DNA-binding protein
MSLSTRNITDPEVTGGLTFATDTSAASGCRRRALFVTGQVSVSTIECGRGRGGSQHTQTFDQPAIVFLRTGWYGRRVGGRASLVDSTQCYLLPAGETEEIQHLGDGYRSTVLTLATELLPTLLRVRSRFAASEFRTSPGADLAHRLMLAECRRGGETTVITEMAVALVADLFAAWTHAPPAARRRGTTAATRRAVDIARELATTASVPRSLQSIATAASVSPQYLTRLFRQSTGLTLTHYRNRVRVRLALERFAEGEADLKRVAHELGFFDQSHFSRTVQAEVGLLPSTLRTLLSAPDATR